MRREDDVLREKLHYEVPGKREDDQRECGEGKCKRKLGKLV